MSPAIRPAARRPDESPPPPATGQLQHSKCDVETDRTARAGSGVEQEVAGSARQIEHAIVPRDVREGDRAPLPAAILPVREEPVMKS